MNLTTTSAMELGHVLDNSNGWYPKQVEHLDAFDHINEAQALGSGYNDSCIKL
jgi:hypothetical protein